VSVRNSCTICVCEKPLYNLCLRETAVQSVSTRNISTMRTLYSCMWLYAVQLFFFFCRIQCLPYISWDRLSLYDAHVRFCKSHHEYGRWYKWSFMHSDDRHWRRVSGHCHSPRYQLFGPITIPDLVPSTNLHPVRESIGQPSASSGSGGKQFFGLHSKEKIFTLNRIDWLSASEWFGLGLKSFICASDQ